MKTLFQKVKNKIFPVNDKNAWRKDRFWLGYKNFLNTGLTKQEDYYDFVELFCLTNGTFNEEINKEIIKTNPAKKIQETTDSIFGELTSDDYKKINTNLNKDGYFHFDVKLPKETIEKLYRFASDTPANVKDKGKIMYNPETPVSEIYRFDQIDLINNEDVQNLIMNPALINMARNYLGSEPIFDFPAMWWSTAFKKEASDEAAQLFHFDMDRIKWLKLFIYVNDVTPENGPHTYIKGSHLPEAKPASVLKKGYARIDDNELAQFYKPEDFVVANGAAGSIFVGDTKCWHKGTPLKNGHRLVLELEYTSSLYGANYPKLTVKNSTPKFKQFCESNKIYSTNIEFN